jgi:cyclophilin family peptidyl-prolyl cis-trans isomerase
LNEFDPSRSNVHGTIAMAKLGSDPNSASNQWFFNLADNGGVPPLGLDFQNGGFTVFGRVLDPGMNVVDAIANLRVFAFPAPFDHLPVLSSYDPASGIGIQAADFVIVNRIPNVKSTTTPTGTLEIFTADVDVTFNSVGTVDTATALSWVGTFSSPPNQSVFFNNGVIALKMSGVMGAPGRAITMYDGAATRPTRYYAYGPTLNDPAPHWYDFSFDGKTGAEIMSDRIILHFVDGKRGDDDLTANNSITHTGAQAVVTENANSSSQAGGGCSIVETPSQTTSNGDWVVISMFLAFVALVRRRTRYNRIQRAPR